MPNMTLHFDTAPGVDATALAAQLQTGLAELPGVEKAIARPVESRDLALDATAVMSFLTVAPVVIAHAAQLVDSIKQLILSCQGLKNAIVEISGRRIPVANLQPADIVAAAESQPAAPAAAQS
jgi:hypothetical protein